MYLGLFLIVSLALVIVVGWVVFRAFLSRDARYERRLKHRNESHWEAEKERQERLLEARMHEIHGKGLRWMDAPVPDEESDRRWGKAAEEKLPIRD